MKSRIEKILDYYKLNPSKFADLINVQRSNISHILSERNKPSMELIQKILKQFPDINTEWFILGKGDMFKHPPTQYDLFETTNPVSLVSEKRPMYNKPNQEELKEPAILKNTNLEIKVKNTENTKEIERIVIFYKDKTFTEYKDV